MSPALRERLQPRVDRLGYLGGFFQLAGYQPDALAAFIDYTEASRRAVPDDIAEVVALTVAQITRNDYERHQHERLAVSLGLGATWVEDVGRLEPEEGALTREQRVVQRWVIAALNDHGHGSGPALRELVNALEPMTAIAVVLLCGRYLAHSTLVNSFSIDPPVASIFSRSDSNSEGRKMP